MGGPLQRKWRSHSARSPGHTQRGAQPLLQRRWDLCPELIKKEPGSFRIQQSPRSPRRQIPVSQDCASEVPPISESKEHITTLQEKAGIKAWLFSSLMSAFLPGEVDGENAVTLKEGQRTKPKPLKAAVFPGEGRNKQEQGEGKHERLH